MKNLRKYGRAPYRVAVIHGGPGACGEMAPVARELTSRWGVLEPLQTAAALEGLIKELKAVLEKNGDIPVTLIGFSWGAWLSFIFAAKYPSIVKKLILVGSGPYEEKYATKILQTRLNRLSEKDRTEAESIIEILNDPAVKDKNTVFARFGALFSKADAYDPIIHKSEVIDCSYDIYQSVWNDVAEMRRLFSKADAYDPIIHKSEVIDCSYDIYQSVWNDVAEMRRSGELLKLGQHIKCPVVAIHGDYDLHPSQGVQKPLSTILKNFRFIMLKNCGHRPWIERTAKDRFYEILKEELS
jgi:pimeloyl-ACP methyl ester carboxylesterase